MSLMHIISISGVAHTNNKHDKKREKHFRCMTVDMKSVGKKKNSDLSRSRDENCIACRSERKMPKKSQKEFSETAKVVYVRGGNGNKLLIYFYGSLMSRILLYFFLLFYFIFLGFFQGCPKLCVTWISCLCVSISIAMFFLRKRHCRMAKQTNQMSLPVSFYFRRRIKFVLLMTKNWLFFLFIFDMSSLFVLADVHTAHEIGTFVVYERFSYRNSIMDDKHRVMKLDWSSSVTKTFVLCLKINRRNVISELCT